MTVAGDAQHARSITTAPGVQLYAVIKKSSKYRDQQSRAKKGEGIGGAQPFPVSFDSLPAKYWFQRDISYVVRGNSNQYRTTDLTFYVKAGEVWVSLS